MNTFYDFFPQQQFRFGRNRRFYDLYPDSASIKTSLVKGIISRICSCLEDQGIEIRKHALPHFLFPAHIKLVRVALAHAVVPDIPDIPRYTSFLYKVRLPTGPAQAAPRF